MRLLRLTGLVLALAVLAQTPRAAEETDRVTGLALDGDWQLVQANCTECHSALLITQNSGSRGVWQIRIATMRNTRGMEELDTEVEERILDYLAEHYGQRQTSRRPPL
ncbi:MAG: hypothetical protein F4234_04285, partial [Gammaproteobacteria bacterium]|nr:hypothetical protein [Gammaproteobacteria bacterium]